MGGVIALAALLLVRRSLAGVGDALAGPKWLLLGGVMGVFIIFSITVRRPADRRPRHLGTAHRRAVRVATVIDRYGWFGVERIPLSWPRVLGICLLFAGAALTLRR